MIEFKDFNKTILKSSLYIYLSKVIVTVFSSLIFIFIARKLSIGDYGLYSLFSSSLILFSVLLPLGFPTSILRFIPELIETNDLYSASHLIKRCLLLILGWGIVFLLLSFASGGLVGKILNNYSLRLYLPLWTVIGIIGAQVAVLESVSNSLFLQFYNTIYESIANIIQFFLIILFFKYGYGIYGIMLAIGIANLILFLLYFNKISKVLFNKALLSQIKVEFKRFLKFSSKEFFMKATAFFWDVAIDIYIITYMLGPGSAGLFGFAAFSCFFLTNWMPGMALQNLIRPLLVKVYTANKSSKQLDYFLKFYYKFKAFFIFPVVILMWLLIDKIILIVFQEKFLQAVTAFRILLFFAMLQSFMRPLNNIFAVLERNEIPLFTNSVILYRIPASLLLIKYFGIQGAAWAFGSSILIMFLIQFFWLKKIININFPYISLLKIIFNSLIMGAVIFFLRNKITNLFYLILAIVLGAISYIIISLLNKSFKENERSLINGIIGIKIWHF